MLSKLLLLALGITGAIATNSTDNATSAADTTTAAPAGNTTATTTAAASSNTPTASANATVIKAEFDVSIPIPANLTANADGTYDISSGDGQLWAGAFAAAIKASLAKANDPKVWVMIISIKNKGRRRSLSPRRQLEAKDLTVAFEVVVEPGGETDGEKVNLALTKTEGGAPAWASTFATAYNAAIKVAIASCSTGCEATADSVKSVKVTEVKVAGEDKTAAFKEKADTQNAGATAAAATTSSAIARFGGMSVVAIALASLF